MYRFSNELDRVRSQIPVSCYDAIREVVGAPRAPTLVRVRGKIVEVGREPVNFSRILRITEADKTDMENDKIFQGLVDAIEHHLTSHRYYIFTSNPDYVVIITAMERT